MEISLNNPFGPNVPTSESRRISTFVHCLELSDLLSLYLSISKGGNMSRLTTRATRFVAALAITLSGTAVIGGTAQAGEVAPAGASTSALCYTHVNMNGGRATNHSCPEQSSTSIPSLGMVKPPTTGQTKPPADTYHQTGPATITGIPAVFSAGGKISLPV